MAVVETRRFDIFLISLDPTQGSEIKKTRPCLIVSPPETNTYSRTLIVAPMTSKINCYPTRIPVLFDGKEGNIVLDQIRTIDKSRMIKKLGTLPPETASEVLDVLGAMFS